MFACYQKRTQSLLTSLIVIAGICLAILGHVPVEAAGPALVQVIDTWRWNKPSPDPAGITYWPAHDTLVIADSEIDEMAIFAGANVFESTRAGAQVQTYDVSALNNEAAGIDLDVAPNGRFFISNDSQKKIFDWDPGPDRVLGTADDVVRVFLTSSFGNNDPEGLTIGPNGNLYTVDGTGQEVYITNPGSGGLFGDGNDTTTHFDVAVIGIGDPEGIDYNAGSGTFYIADRKTRKVWEITPAGALVRSIDMRALVASARDLGDVTLAPSSTGSGQQNLYIVDRGVDNNVDPNENDGKIYEISLGDTPADTTAPTVTRRQPALNAAGVSVGSNVLATFDEAVSGADVAGNFTLTGPDGSSVAADVSYDASTRTATLDPHADLAQDTLYTAHLTSAITDQAGNPLAALDWSFTAAGAAPANLLANPSFEIDNNADNRPDVWSSSSRFTRVCGASVPAPGAHEGSCVGKFFATDNSNITITQNVPVEAGKTYNFTAWVNIPATADAFTFKLQVRWLTSSNSTISTKTAKTYTAATSGWNQTTFSAVVPSGAATAQVRLNISSLGTSIYVDDVGFQSAQ